MSVPNTSGERVMPNKPIGQHCINVSPGKTSHLLLKKKGPNFPPVGNANGNIQSAVVHDDDNIFDFTAIPVAQANLKRLALRITSNLPLGAGGPTDGLLTVTLQILQPDGSTQPLAVSDVPVDYIDDPNAP